MKAKDLTRKLIEDLESARNGNLSIKKLNAFTNTTGKILTGEFNIHKYNIDMGNSLKNDFFEE